MKRVMGKLEYLLSLGGIKKDIVLLVISGIAVVCSLLKFQPFPFDMAWFAIILCGLPIILEAIIGLVTEFDIKADVLVSLALIASVCIGEDFAAGEVAEKLGDVIRSMKADRQTVLIVNGDRDTPHKYISAVLNAAAKAGCLQVRINAEVRKENP